MEVDSPLSGRCALVTGSTRGLGAAVARRLAEAGCHVVLHGLEPAEDVEELREAIARECGVRAVYLPADLRDRAAIARLMATAADAFTAVDVLVNNAVLRHEAPIEGFRPDWWDEALAVNLTAAFHTIRMALPAMRRRKWGRIINVSSIYGLQGAANRAGYVTTKTALIGLTRAVALETVADGITCNAVCPGTLDTPVHLDKLAAAMRATGAPREQAERQLLAGKQPSGRLIDAGHAAGLIAFLAGPDGASITGTALPVDSGWSVS